MINFRRDRTHATVAPVDDQITEGVIMVERETYPAQMYDDVSHEAYAGVGQVRAIDGPNAYVMYVDGDAVEGYWVPRHELTVHESTKE